MNPDAQKLISGIVGRPITSSTELLPIEIDHCLDCLAEAAERIVQLSNREAAVLSGVKNPTLDQIAYGRSW